MATSIGTQTELTSIVRQVAEQAGPGEEIEAYAVRRMDVDVKVYDGEVEEYCSAAVAGIGIRVIKDHRQGFAYAGAITDEIVAEVLAEARDNVAFGTQDEALGLPSEADVTGVAPPELDLESADFDDFSPEAKVRIALDLEKLVYASDHRIRTVESAGYGDVAARAAVANSHGLVVETGRTVASISAVAIAEDKTGPQTGFGYDLGRDPTTLDLSRVAHEAAEKATRLLGATKPKTERVRVVLDQFVARSLIGVVASTLMGEAVIKGRSIFGDRVGEAVAAGCVTLIDDPTDPAVYGASSHDAEGVPTRRNVFVENGVLAGFAHNVYTARRFGTLTTGSASRASYRSTPGVGMRSFAFEPGVMTLDEMLRAADGGIYVQAFKGMHSGVNPISGDFSVGIDALRIRDGEIGDPIREATLASTLQRMLLDIVAIGSEVRQLSGGPAMPVLMAEMIMAGD